MRRAKDETRLDVAGLLAHGSLRGTTALYLAPSSGLIEGVVLVSQLEAIRQVRPNTVVVLSAEMGSGGWLVSAALRLAWERRAGAVVVAGSVYASAAVGLAERLGITLLATDGDPAALALALAAEIGAALSVVDAELARFARTVAKDTTLSDVIKTISRELDGFGVSLEHDGVVLASAGMPPRETDEVITMEVGEANSAVRFTLTARVPASGDHNLRLVRSILEVATPAVKASWLLEDLLGTSRAVPTAAIAGLDQDPAASGAEFGEKYRHLLNQLGWREGELYVAVWFRGGQVQDHRPELTAVLRLLWRKVTLRSPLAEVQGGWLALVPAGDQDASTQLENRIRTRLGPALAELGLVAGLSRWQEDTPALASIVREARLAAESVRSAGPGTVLGFASLGAAAATSFVDIDAVALVAELSLPRLMTSPDRDVIITAVAAFLDHRGSVSLAATFLNLHRNTLQARLNRARELGVPLDNPSELLSVHLIAHVLRRSMPDQANTPGPSSDSSP
ncbi:helix-turn-helix domain-containing protein [Arthrobacter celericrescens]|uniref:helix-turn-helix domain-containing protein n=1 Tax=Arthrobacter celericrescens TaxID=2320851 RepID=UPI001FDF53BE|nr:helix-turn-helix domain-containing protein [Arthrobacter celericrescens]